MKHNRNCIFVALLLLIVTTGLYLFGFLDKVEYFLSDSIHNSFRPAQSDIFVIGIDSDTVGSYGPWGTWSRKLTADLINYLNEDEESKPAVIGLDILFSGNTTDGEDGELVQAVRDGGNVIVASQAYFSSKIDRLYTNEEIQKYEQPFQELSEAASSGLINLFADSDGTVRRGIYQYAYEGQNLLSFAAQIANTYREKEGLGPVEVPPLDQEGRWLIPFAGEPGVFYGTGTKGTSWIRVMNQEIPRELFADSIVLIGPYASGMMDHYATSADPSNPMFGVEIHANMIQSLLEGNYKRPVPGYLMVLFSVVLTVLSYLAFCRYSIKLWTGLSLGGCAAVVLLSWGGYRVGYLIPMFYPLLTIVVVYLALLIANSVFLTIEKASLYDQMQKLFVRSIRTIASAIDAKDPCTSGHCQRVSEYSLMLGKGIHCSEEELRDLEYSALLHDVGKIGISDSVLKKDGPLTDEEYAEMKLHPKLGAQILNDIEEFKGNITDGARYHHERYDGRGYCEGVAGEDIPLFGRIIAIADAYDAMTQNRPYRNRLSKEIAIGELKKGSGTQFDPGLAEVFIRMIEEDSKEGKA